MCVEDAWKLCGQVIQTISMEERGRTEKKKKIPKLESQICPEETKKKSITQTDSVKNKKRFLIETNDI